MILRSMVEGPSAYTVSPKAAVNFLLFRIYEASEQLARYNRPRIAVIIIDDLAWPRFQIQLQDNWVDWTNPEFLPDDPEWEAYRQKQKKLLRITDLPKALLRSDAVWIIQRTYGYEFQLEYGINMPNR